MDDLTVGLAVDLGCGLTLESPIMNAAGSCKSKERVEALIKSACSAIVWGSITSKTRTGAQGQTFGPLAVGALNSVQLANRGMRYVQRHLPTLRRKAHDAGKRIIVSVAGFSPREFGRLAYRAVHAGADAIELNLGCPNVIDNDEQQRIICYDAALTEETLDCVQAAIGTEVAVGVKISWMEPHLLSVLATILSNSTVVSYVTAINSLANAYGYVYDADGVPTPCLTPNQGLGGLSGPAIKPLALGQVAQLHKQLAPWIAVVGVGGITCGRDVREFLRCGAQAVQIGTHYMQRSGERREQVFSQLLEELFEELPDEPA